MSTRKVLNLWVSVKECKFLCFYVSLAFSCSYWVAGSFASFSSFLSGFYTRQLCHVWAWHSIAMHRCWSGYVIQRRMVVRHFTSNEQAFCWLSSNFSAIKFLRWSKQEFSNPPAWYFSFPAFGCGFRFSKNCKLIYNFEIRYGRCCARANFQEVIRPPGSSRSYNCFYILA